MVFDILFFVILFVVYCFGNGCLIYFIWWIIGQPQPATQLNAQFVEGRVFSHIGRKLCDWYERFAQIDEQRIVAIVDQKTYDNQEERNIEYYNISRTHRKANPAKAFGVCPICMGTYLIIFLNIIALILIGFIFGYLASLCVSIPFMLYGWALSLTALKVTFL